MLKGVATDGDQGEGHPELNPPAATVSTSAETQARAANLSSVMPSIDNPKKVLPRDLLLEKVRAYKEQQKRSTGDVVEEKTSSSEETVSQNEVEGFAASNATPSSFDENLEAPSFLRNQYQK